MSNNLSQPLNNFLNGLVSNCKDTRVLLFNNSTFDSLGFVKSKNYKTTTSFSEIQNEKYTIVLGFLPLGMQQVSIEINQRSINVPENY